MVDLILTRSRAMALVALTVAALSACGEGASPQAPQPIYLSPLEQDAYAPIIIQDPGTGVSPQELERFGDLFKSVEQSAQDLFEREGVESKLDLIERAYISAARYQDLVAMYASHVQARGLQSRVAPRLAWAWIKLGQDRRARTLIEALLGQAPTSPERWFLLGAYWLREADADAAASARTTLAWERLLTLSPAYLGFDGIDALAIRREVNQQRARKSWTQAQLDAAQAELDALAAGPAPASPAPEVDPAQAPEPSPEPEPTPALDPALDPAPEPAPEPTPEPVPQAKRPEVTPPAPWLIELTRAKLAMLNQDRAEAARHMEASLKGLLGTHPSLAKAVEAAADQPEGQLLTFIKLDWELGRDRQDAANALRALVARPGVSGATLYEAATFAQRKLEDKALAKELFARAKAQGVSD